MLIRRLCWASYLEPWGKNLLLDLSYPVYTLLHALYSNITTNLELWGTLMVLGPVADAHFAWLVKQL